MMVAFVPFVFLLFIMYKIYRYFYPTQAGTMPESQGQGNKLYPDLTKLQGNSILRMFNSSSCQTIVDRFSTLTDVGDAIRRAGLESCNLIFGIDFTISNLQQGQQTFGGRSLHYLQQGLLNPYQQVVCYLGETLESFNTTGQIHAFGFGDVSTRDTSVFPFRSQSLCRSFHDVLNDYQQIVHGVNMSGPTSFAPLIHRAIDIVRQTRQYHILVIVADGQVTNERTTQNAIIEASRYPLSIIMIGVGDGPWDTMSEYDDKLPTRRFDNFQFVDFHSTMATSRNPQAAFALNALMEIPDQYKAIQRLGLIDQMD